VHWHHPVKRKGGYHPTIYTLRHWRFSAGYLTDDSCRGITASLRQLATWSSSGLKHKQRSKFMWKTFALNSAPEEEN